MPHLAWSPGCATPVMSHSTQYTKTRLSSIYLELEIFWRYVVETNFRSNTSTEKTGTFWEQTQTPHHWETSVNPLAMVGITCKEMKQKLISDNSCSDLYKDTEIGDGASLPHVTLTRTHSSLKCSQAGLDTALFISGPTANPCVQSHLFCKMPERIMTESKEVRDGSDLLGSFSISHEPGRIFPRAIFITLPGLVFNHSSERTRTARQSYVILLQKRHWGILYLWSELSPTVVQCILRHVWCG